MSPSSQVHDDQASRRGMNGSRPSSLRLSKDSHLIHKASSSSSSSDVAPASKPHQQRQPVIIYTHSPKIIHTHARDFMALVQKLTGLSRSEDPSSSLKDDSQPAPDSPKYVNTMEIDSDNGSDLMNENCNIGEAKVSSSSVFPAFDPLDPVLSDSIPLFTPNSSFCSSYPFYRYPEPVFFSPSHVGSSISPSPMEALRSFPEY